MRLVVVAQEGSQRDRSEHRRGRSVRVDLLRVWVMGVVMVRVVVLRRQMVVRVVHRMHLQMTGRLKVAWTMC